MEELDRMRYSAWPSERARARRIMRREEEDPFVWCERFRHKRRLSVVNTGKPCPFCKEEKENNPA